MAKCFDGWNPEYSEYVNKSFIYNGQSLIVKHREPTEKKTELYLWNLTRMCFVSGLVPQGANKFKFTPMGSKASYILDMRDFSIQKLG